MSPISCTGYFHITSPIRCTEYFHITSPISCEFQQNRRRQIHTLFNVVNEPPPSHFLHLLPDLGAIPYTSAVHNAVRLLRIG
jgi:hypothetical protein